MEQGIKFVITGDSKGLEDSTKKVEKEIDALGGKIKQLQKDIADNVRITQGYEKAISDLSQEFKNGRISQDQYAKSLARLQRDEKETTVETARLRKELRQLQQDQKSLAVASTGLTGANAKLGKSQRNASAGAVEFGRLLGDLPYGIQGVANNIQQLAFVMGGGAALQIGIAAVTGLMVLFRDEIGSIGQATNELAKATKDYLGDANAEITTLKTLVTIANDESKSKNERREALSRINDQYGEYLGNLTLEELATQKVREQVELLNKAFIAQARVKGAEDLISEKARKQAEELLELESNLIDARKQAARSTGGGAPGVGQPIFQAAQILEALEKDIAGFAEKSAKEMKPFEDLLLGLQEQEIKIKASLDPSDADPEITSKLLEKTRKEFIDSQKQLTEEQKKEAKKRIADLERTLAQQAAIRKRINTQVFKDEQKDAVEIAQETASQITDIYISSGGRDFALGIADKIKKEADASEEPIKRLEAQISSIDDVFKELSVSSSIDSFVEGLNNADLSVFQEKLNALKLTSSVLAEGFSSAFQTMSSSLSESLKTGNKVLDSFVGSIINSLGQLISALISNAIKQIAINQAVATSNAVAGGSSSGAATGPGAVAAIPIMIAALVAVVAGAFASIGKFAQGGIVGGGSFTGDQIFARLNSGERVLTAQDQSMLTRFLRGETMGSTNQMNGANSIEVFGALRGDTIYLSNQRASRNNKRFYGA